MNKFYPIALLAILAFSRDAVAQKFINGDLEANSECGLVRNFQFNTFLYKAGYGFSNVGSGFTTGEFFLLKNSGAGCPEGPPQKGTYFLGLASYTYGQTDAMSLELDTALKANKTYKLTFYTKKSKTGSGAIALNIGYTTDSLNFGTMVTTVQAPTSTAWVLQSVNIRPTVPTRFITVRAVVATTGGNFQSYTYVDNFSIAVGTDVASESIPFSIAPHPNPFRDNLTFTLDAKAKMPCTVTLSDMTGRVVMSREVSNPNVQIPREGLSSGVYLLRARDAAGMASMSRVVAE